MSFNLRIKVSERLAQHIGIVKKNKPLLQMSYDVLYNHLQKLQKHHLYNHLLDTLSAYRLYHRALHFCNVYLRHLLSASLPR